jgi:hypothetical protein
MPDQADARTFTYGEVVNALAFMHGIDRTTMGAFEARIRHFQRLGIAPSSPGKGKRIQYDFSAALVWAFCLELAEFGIAPEIIKKIVDVRGESIITHSPRGDGDVLFWFTPMFLVAGRFDEEFHEKEELMLWSGIELASDLVLDFSRPPGRRRPGKDEAFRSEPARRLLIINVSALRRLLGEALIPKAPRA